MVNKLDRTRDLIMKLKYIGNVFDEQVNWGRNDDPRGILEDNKVYEVDRSEVHSSYTKIYLKEFPNMKFNSVHFEECGD